MATVAEQARNYIGKGPGGANLIAWEHPVTHKRISGNMPGDSSYNIPVWGSVGAMMAGGEGGGGGFEWGGGGSEYKAPPIYKPLFKSIIKDLNGNPFDANKFSMQANQALEPIGLNALRAGRAASENLVSRGLIHSGQVAEQGKNVAEAEIKDINDRLNQMAEAEATFSQSKRERALAQGSGLFSNILNAQTSQKLAEQNRAYQEKLAASMMAFQENQNNLNRALEREKIQAAISASRRGGGGLDFAASVLSGASPFLISKFGGK